MRNISLTRFIYNRACTRPEAYIFSYLSKALDNFIPELNNIFIRCIFSKQLEQIDCLARHKKSGIFFYITEYNIINSFSIRFSCAAEACIHPCKCLQFKSHVFDYMSCPCTFFNALEKSTGFFIAAAMLFQCRQHDFQLWKEVRNFIGWLALILFEVKTHYNKFSSSYAPVVRTAERSYFKNFHGFKSQIFMIKNNFYDKLIII